MKYILLIYSAPDAQPAENTPEAQEEFGRWMTVTEDMAKAGVLAAGDPLQGHDTATTVRMRDGERVLSDGPFAETKEILGGYYLLDVPDLEAALDWAAQLPNATYGSVEVRPVMEIPTG